MENQEINPKTGNDKVLKNSCNVNSTFNFIVGAISIAVSATIGYMLYQYL